MKNKLISKNPLSYISKTEQRGHEKKRSQTIVSGTSP
jgi:hypothetical protein